ncbi:uncharacterized protein BYT42DRAFT_524387 [Radiomyces spectabilis]|uniref:uncharacterized protein n=1 Tax=Radiomyces spectabilis TaxID=64574 RepID=UPI00221E5525|nr:uncharacterized protein BYT42DRAFT_524387 [Radiomyces spectabilis]KAI8393376.1 hypothetical protein BYT42DRAFT_524387 [Radiomyces spectabilis]
MEHKPRKLKSTHSNGRRSSLTNPDSSAKLATASSISGSSTTDPAVNANPSLKERYNLRAVKENAKIPSPTQPKSKLSSSDIPDSATTAAGRSHTTATTRPSKKRKQTESESSKPLRNKRNKTGTAKSSTPKSRSRAKNTSMDKSQTEVSGFKKTLQQKGKQTRQRKTSATRRERNVSSEGSQGEDLDETLPADAAEGTSKRKGKAKDTTSKSTKSSSKDKLRRSKKQADPETLNVDDSADSDMDSTPMSYFDFFHGENEDEHTMDDDIASDEDDDERHHDLEESYDQDTWDRDHDNEDDEDEDDQNDSAETDDELARARRNLGYHMQGLFGGMTSDMSNRLRSILSSLKNQEDSTMQLIALQELAEILSVSSEDNLAGFFTSDSFAKELVRIMKGQDGMFAEAEMDNDMMLALAMSGGLGGGNPEIMLLACRCISNLLDAMPSAITSIVYHGAVRVLCQKLKSIEYIDLAEQALCALEKIAAQLPRAVVHEGGLSAALMYFDFFSIHSQRTALRTAANCMRTVNVDSFSQVMEVVPTLLNTISYPDRSVVELTCLCWVRIAESFRNHREQLEKAVSIDLLKTLIGLIPVPGNANAVRPATFMDLLRIFRAISKSSSQLACELLHLKIITILYQVVTGMAEPAQDLSNLPAHDQINLDSKWRDSTLTIMKIIADLLPSVPKDDLPGAKQIKDGKPVATRTRSSRLSSDEKLSSKSAQPDPRVQLFKDQPKLLQQIGQLLVPLLLEIYTSTVNLRVRQLVTHTLVKLIYYSDTEVLKVVLKDVPLSGFLAGLLTQQEHPVLVIDTLYQAQLLVEKLPDPYHFLFEREGVFHGIESLANETATEDMPINNALAVEENDSDARDIASNFSETQGSALDQLIDSSDLLEGSEMMEDIEGGDEGLDEADNETNEELDDDDQEQSKSGSKGDPSGPPSVRLPRTRFSSNDDKEGSSSLNARRKWFENDDLHQLIRQSRRQARTSTTDPEKGLGRASSRLQITQLAQCFIQKYEEQTANVGRRADNSLKEIQKFVQNLNGSKQDPAARQVLENMLQHLQVSTTGISSFELTNSGLVDALLAYLTDESYSPYASLQDRRSTFRQVLIEAPSSAHLKENTPTALHILVTRLQELLSRFEPFEVVAPLESSSGEHFRNPTNMLAKQLRLRLTGEGDNIPREYRHLMVSTHAVATFKLLEEYLLTRIGGPTSSKTSKGRDRPKRSDSGDRSKVEDTDSCHETTAEDDLHNIDKMSLDEDDEEMDDVQTSTKNSRKIGSKKEAEKNKATSSRRETLRSHSKKSATSSSADEQADNEMNERGEWKIQFSLKDTPISTDTTVYGAVHQYELRNKNPLTVSRNIWATAYPVSFERVWVPEVSNSAKVSSSDHQPVPQLANIQCSDVLSSNTDCVKVLGLLKALASLARIFECGASSDRRILVKDFVNRKLTAKMNRQLEEPLIVASACLPDWVYWLMKEAPFLFPFETRYLFIQSTSFGYSRLIARWQSMQMRNNGQNSARDDGQQQQHVLGRMERQKVRIVRSQMLESAIKILDLFGNWQSVLEVEYMDEEGTGLGPTLEFYASTSREFCKRRINMWRDDGDDPSSEYVSCKNQLFPRPLMKDSNSKSTKKIISLFKTLGQFVAKATLDFRIIDIPFSPAFFKVVFSEEKPNAALVEEIDPMLGQSLRLLQQYSTKKQAIYADDTLTFEQKRDAVSQIEVEGARLEDLCLDFTVPGSEGDELKARGAEIPVTIFNVEEYIDLLIGAVAGPGIARQIAAFREGFNGLFAIDDLKILTNKELVALFGVAEEDWCYATLADAVKADHGFTMESQSMKNLLEILSEMNDHERREFLQFTTGSPRLPIGGWKAMRPVFTVVRKVPEAPLTADDYLPSVMTCANYLKMPDYSNKETMRKRLFTSMQEGKDSFLLS